MLLNIFCNKKNNYQGIFYRVTTQKSYGTFVFNMCMWCMHVYACVCATVCMSAWCVQTMHGVGVLYVCTCLCVPQYVCVCVCVCGACFTFCVNVVHNLQNRKPFLALHQAVADVSMDYKLSMVPHPTPQFLHCCWILLLLLSSFVQI